MDPKEFKAFVISNAKRYIFEGQDLSKNQKDDSKKEKAIVSESVSPEKIKLLAEEMKKINKKIDLRNPLISPELFDIISKEKTIGTDEKSNRWKNLYNYEIPQDDSR